MNLLVTGGCGFIGSNFIKHIINKKQVFKLVNLDILSYAGDLKNVKEFENDRKYYLQKVDLRDSPSVSDVFYKHDITHVVHLAAETHVDNSIFNADAFLESNVLGTHNLLKAALKFKIERFHHVSTDEVYGHLKEGDKKFSENTSYNPRNPYAASKAASDFLVKSYFHTHGLPITISNCSNNYGPNQYGEKFIPKAIESILFKSKIPVYGTGKNVRDWIYVEDHCRAIWSVLNKGTIGETYLVGANCEKTNLEIINLICKILKVYPEQHIEFVKDRAGHDFRYAINNRKIKSKLNWKPLMKLKDGLKKTIEHYDRKLS